MFGWGYSNGGSLLGKPSVNTLYLVLSTLISFVFRLFLRYRTPPTRFVPLEGLLSRPFVCTRRGVGVEHGKGPGSWSFDTKYDNDIPEGDTETSNGVSWEIPII